MPGMLRVELALETPEHIIGIEVAAGREVFGALELDPAPQVEGIGQAIGADVPALGQARLDIGGAGLEVHQAVEHRFGGGIGGRRRGVLDDIEPFGAGLGANHQWFADGRCSPGASGDTQQCGCQGSL
ncbi:hypothetical protein D3C85_897720 [compost metagenome]